ncbi:4-amino-4-deoxy-L-arabinose-phospho-UDP flippase [Veronia pacifica]|uniref:4-amino-4-deoxy-L-arabinose-phospho-UDP flippase n=1 Tax=Veronia pacifica TaxID=1080227 RepID=A0A1C3E9D2_9GAMM|nr:4-amino-4-deoxy-L-arabinose-phospho-UDP flippase [Veronia pacifica]
MSIASSSGSQYWQKKTAIYFSQHPTLSMQAKILAKPLMLSVVFIGLSAISWLGVLRDWSVSIAYPMLSLNFVIMLLISRYCFNETLSLRHWVGSVMILSGVSLLGSSL